MGGAVEFGPPYAAYARRVERRIRLFRLVPREKGGGAPVEPQREALGKDNAGAWTGNLPRGPVGARVVTGRT